LPKLPNWSRQIEADPDFLDPFQPEIPLLSEFGVTLGNVFRRVTGPEVFTETPQSLLQKMRSAESSGR
jgi:hypothetical protein